MPVKVSSLEQNSDMNKIHVMITHIVLRDDMHVKAFFKQKIR